MEDVRSRDRYQETGQEKRPARMVGLPSLESTSLGKDAEATRSALLDNGGGKDE